MATLLNRFARNEEGATAIEYSLIATGIAMAIIATVQGLGAKVTSSYVSVSNALN